MVRLSSVFAATALLLSTAFAVSTTTAAGFVSDDGAVGFTLTIPFEPENADKLYFVISAPIGASWVAIGMGKNHMKDSLIYMMYYDSTGNNVTVSPRLSYGNTEPSFTSNITYRVEPGSGIFNGRMIANVLCSNCREWKGGSIDPTDTAADFIYAVGPDQDLRSNDVEMSVLRHVSYGTFSMDLTKAVGQGQMPFAFVADTSGTTKISFKGDRNLAAAFHAVFMIFAFVILMPLGVFILRGLNSPRWHGVNQIFSIVMALVGVFLGFYCSTFYNRTKDYNSAHQIFGLVIIILLIGQAIIGLLHHRMFSVTKTPTKFGLVHANLGRIIIPAGLANAFLGFALAQNPKYFWSLLSLSLLVLLVLLPLWFWRYKRNNTKARHARSLGQDGPTGYQAQPWNSAAPAQSDINLSQMNYPPQPAPQQQGRQFV